MREGFVAFEVSIDKGAIFSIQKGSLKDVDTDELVQGPAALRVMTLPGKRSGSEKTEIIELIKETVGEGEDITKPVSSFRSAAAWAVRTTCRWQESWRVW